MNSNGIKTAETLHSSLENSQTKTVPESGPTVDDLEAKGDQNIATDQEIATAGVEYPSGLRLGFIMTSVFVGMFLVSLDRMIIATAIPQITNDFGSVADIGWYGSAYLLTTCTFQLLYGKLYSFYSIKVIYLIAIFLFELGSAVSGAAPNSVAFIIGRAIAGVGGAGIASGMIVVIAHAVPLHKRPLYQGMIGAVFGIASVMGPLLGGALTSKANWRWCFYINLPFGGLAMVVIVFLLKIPDQDATKLPARAKLAQLDFYGTALIMPGIVCLILALQWGGLKYSWKDDHIIVLLVLSSLLLLGFMLVQLFLPKTATIAPRIFMQRSILAGTFSSLCIGSHMMIFFYYIPLWFQAVQELTAVESGIRTFPLVLSMVVASIITGVLVHRIGYYTPLMIIGVCFMSVGAGLLTTLQIDTPTANLIGYQILYGCGLCLSSQAPFLAAQAVLPKADIPIGAALMFFSQLLSGAVFVSVGQNIFENQLLHRLSSVPDFRPEMIQDSGAASLANVPSSLKATVLVAYNESLRQLFQVALIIVCVSLLGALTMEWRSVKKNVVKQEKSNEDDDRKHVEEKSKDAHDGIVKGERSQTDDNECAVTG